MNESNKQMFFFPLVFAGRRLRLKAAAAASAASPAEDYEGRWSIALQCNVHVCVFASR